MATITWNGAGSSNNWDSTDNWDSTSLPTSSDDVFFNTTSTKDCTVNLSPYINSLSITSGFTGKWLLTGYDLTTVTGFSDNGTGARNYGNSITLTGDGTFHVGSAVPISTTSCSLYLKGNDLLDSSRQITFANMDLSYSGKKVTNLSTVALFINDGTFHLHGGTYSTGIQGIYCNCTTQTNPLLFDTSSSVSSTPYLYVRSQSNISINIPSFPTNWYALYIQGLHTSGTATFNINGNINISYLIWYQNGAGGTLTINTNNYSISANGGYLFSGSNNATGIFNLNCGSSSITISGAFRPGNYSAGVSNYDFGTSSWNIAGAFTAVANNNFTNTTTSSISFTSSIDSTVTSLGKTLPAITINKSGGRVNFANTFVCKSLTVSSSNASSLITASSDITSSGNVIFDGAGNLTLNGNIQLLSDGTCRFASTLGTVGATVSGLEFDGTRGSAFTDNKGIILKNFALGSGAIATINGTQTTTFTSSSTPLTFINGGTLIVNRSIIFSTIASIPFYSVTGSPSISGSSNLYFRSDTSDTPTLPAITVGVLNGFIVYPNTNITSTINQTGDITTGGTFGITTASSGTGSIIFNTQNYKLNTGNMWIGSQTSDASCTINCGSSILYITSYVGTQYNTGPSTLNMSTSVWYVTGNWTNGTNQTFNQGTSIVTFDGTSSATITSASKSFYDVACDKSGGSVTFLDTPNLHNLTVNTTNNKPVSWSGYSLTSSGDVQLNGSGNLNMGTGVTFNGASSILSLANTLGTVTATSTNLIFNGTSGCSFTDNKGITIVSLTTGPSAILTTNGSASTIINKAGIPLVVGNDSTLTVNSALDIRTTQSNAFITVGTGYAFNGSANMAFKINANSINTTMPDLTYSGTGAITISTNSAITGSTFSFSNPFNLGTGSLILTSDTGGANINYLYNNQTLTCGDFYIGAPSGSTNFHYFNYTPLSIRSLGVQSTSGTTKVYMQASNITCSGDWTYGSTHNIYHAWDLVTFSSNNNVNVTSAGKTFDNLVINIPSDKTLSTVDSMVVRGLNLISGNVGNSFRILPDTVVVADILPF